MASYAIVIVLLLAAVAGVFLLLRMRNAGMALHAQIAGVAELTGKLGASLESQAAGVNENFTHLNRHVGHVDGRVANAEVKLQEIAAQTAELAAAVRDTADLMAGRLSHPMPLDRGLLAGRSEGEIVELAERLAIVRPLAPYPRWRTDIDYLNPDFSYQLRRWLWQYFKDCNRETAIVLPWHDGTKLRLFLGSDLSRQIYVSGCCEPNEFAVLDRLLRPGMTFFDAGANDGIYTVFAARRVGAAGAVWAFEPSAREVEHLQYNLRINQLAAKVLPIALSDQEGQAELTVATFEHPGCNTLGAFAHADFEVARKEAVRTRRLDDVVAEDPPARIDVLKMDVEGAELRLLRGSSTTLKKYRPAVLFEVSEQSLRHQGGTPRELLELLLAAGYVIYSFDPNTGLPVPADGVLADNMIGFPREIPIPEGICEPWPSRSDAVQAC